MKKILFIMLFLATLAGSTNAQNNTNTKLKRTLLFTLGANEEIYYDEYFVMQQMNQNRFACIIYDTLNNTQTFVFNGKRILTADYLHEGYGLFHYLNVHEENGYVVEYEWQEKNYVNIKGKVYGPFDGYSLSFAKDNKGNENYDRFYYRKEENGNKNYYIHYDGVKAGPFEMVRFPYKYGAFSDCEYLYALMGKCYAHYSNGTNLMTPLVIGDYYEDNGKWYVNINGNTSRGYDLRFTENGKYAYYHYKENGKEYVNINGNNSRGYDKLYFDDLHLTESGKYAYRYKENGKEYVNIDGRTSRGYYGLSYLHFTESGKYAYCYKENGKEYVNINGRDSGGYDYVNVENIYLRFTESGKYAYSYQENFKSYVNINGNKRRGYDLHFTESGKYAYCYWERDKAYVNINGSPSRGYDNVDDLCFTESGKYAYCYKENGKWYVYINGRKSSRGYDSVDDLHFTEDGQYAYRYKENKIWYQYININDRESREDVYDLSISDNGSYYYGKDDGRIYKTSNGAEIEIPLLEGIRLGLFGNDNSSIEIYSTDHKHSFHSVYKYEYIVIDGERYGRSPALYALYDKEKNAFIWNSVEGKELVVYEYKLN
jgi:hypothetical protein